MPTNKKSDTPTVVPRIGETIKVKPVEGRTVINTATGEAFTKTTEVAVTVRIIRLLKDGDLTQ